MANENIFSAVFDDTEAIRFLDNIEKKLGSVGNEADALTKDLHAAFNEIKQGAKAAGDSLGSSFQIGTAQGLHDALNLLQKDYNDLKRASDTLKNALKSATDPALIKLYARGIADLEAGMKNLEKAGGAAGVNLKKVNDAAGTGKQVFEGLFGTLSKAALILGALDAVRRFVTYAVDIAQQITAAKRSIEAFTGSAEEADKIVNDLIATGQKNFIPTDQILSAGKALLAFGENADNLPAVLTRIANVSAATGKNFNELTTIYGKARAAGVLYAEDINQLVDAGIPIIQEFAKQLGVSGDQVIKLASEGKISFEELQLAMFNLTAQGGKFADQATVQSKSIGGAWEQLVATVTPAISSIGTVFSNIVQSGINKLNSLLDFAKKLGAVVGGATLIVPKGDAADKAAQDADRRQFESDIDERLKLEKEAADKRKEIKGKSNRDIAKEERDLEALRISAMQDGVAKEIALENFRFNELVKQLKKHHLDTSDAEAQHQKNLTEIIYNAAVKTADDLAKLEKLRGGRDEFEKAQAKKSKEAQDKALKERIDNLSAARDIEQGFVDIQEEQFRGFIASLESQGTDEKLVAEKKLEFDNLIKQKRLETELSFQEALLSLTDAGDTQRIASIQNSIGLIKAQIDTLSVTSKDGKKSTSIWSLLGTDEEDGKQRFNDALNIITDGLNQIAEARVKEAEAAVQAADDKVKAAEDALNREQDLAEQGLANNSDLRKVELEEAKKARDIALKEETKARKAQILLDSATQASSLITAAANILKGFSTIPLLGQILGVASVAAMFVGFAAAKANALKAVNVPKLRKGDKIIGRTHEQGGELRELEHNEQVVGAKEAENQDLFFERMRQGRYKGIDLARIAERKTDRADPLGESAPRIRSLEQRRAAATEAQHTMLLAKTMESVGDRVVAAIMEKPEAYPWKNGYKQVTRTKSGKTTKTVLPAD